jgi:phytoene desaturase
VRIAVIGSGFGGLSAALRLRAQGHDVTILEKLDQPGGRASVFRRDGFTFDAGPTIITAPWMIDELFALGSKRTADYVSLVRLDPCYRIRFEDGSAFDRFADRDRLRDEVRRFSPADVRGYDNFVREATRIFDAGMALIDKPFTSWRQMARAVPRLAQLRADRSVADLVNRHIRDDRASAFTARSFSTSTAAT